MDNEKRRSSILKSQPPAAVLGNGINADEATSVGAMARRRVSFSTVRTVKEFDHDRNAMTSPHDEPLKLGDTGSSGSLSSAQISQAVDVTMDTTQIVGEFGWQHNTDFLPKATSTPMPRSGLHAPQEADGESKLTMSTDFSTTAHVFGQAECSEMLVCDELGEASMDISGATLTFTDLKKTIAAELSNTNANETTSMNNTRALLAKSPPVSHGRLKHTSMMLTSVSSKRSEDGADRNATMALFIRRDRDQVTNEEPTGDVFKGMNNKESNLEREAAKDQRLSATTFLGVDDGNSAMSFVDESREFWCKQIAAQQPPNESMKSHSLTTAVTDLCDAGDILRQQIAALQVDPSPARLGAARAACSPMAVVKKKTRVESPARLDHGSFRVHGTHPPPADKISLAGCANVEGNAPQQPATPTFRTPETISVCTPEQVSQKLAMTRRRLRRSLDNQPSPLNILKLSDIVVPENALYSISFDFEANSPQATVEESVRHDIDCTRETTRQSNGEVLEEAGETTVMRNQLICSCISNYASLDFDSGITTMACFKSLHSYSDAVKKIKQAALTGTKRLIEQCVERMSEDIAYRLEDSTTQDNIFTLAGFQNLDQGMMSRRESHVFELARLDAQKEWFLVRNEVIAGALRKAEEIIAREMQCYDERMRMLETVKEYQNSKSDEAWIDKQLAELEHFKSTVTEMGNGKDSEALKSELRAAKRAKKRQYLDNMRLDTERLKIELEVSRREAEKSESLTQMLNEREQARKLKRKQLAERADELLRRSH